jgi:predicted HAD superfamily Cof-like phosphohydrolase
MSLLLEKIKSVGDFHDAFLIGNNHSPVLISNEESLLRYTLMREENEEYLEAAQRGDLVEIADALGDQLYILFGTMLRHGLQYKIEEVFDEIHRSNMSKLDENGKPIYREDGKVLKSNLYFRPDIRSILENK